MSVRPVTFSADGSIEVVFDERGHTGTIPPEQIVWAEGIDGPTHQVIRLVCPDGCGGMSTHPVSGELDGLPPATAKPAPSAPASDSDDVTIVTDPRIQTEDVLYWALSPGWSGSVPEGVALPSKLRAK